jgi:hypothetical protein
MRLTKNKLFFQGIIPLILRELFLRIFKFCFIILFYILGSIYLTESYYYVFPYLCY